MTATRTTDDYRASLADTANPDMFSLGYQWADKPHRHVHDLCRMVDTLNAENARMREALKRIADPNTHGWTLQAELAREALGETG